MQECISLFSQEQVSFVVSIWWQRHAEGRFPIAVVFTRKRPFDTWKVRVAAVEWAFEGADSLTDRRTALSATVLPKQS